MKSDVTSQDIAVGNDTMGRQVLLDMVGASGTSWAGMQEHVFTLCLLLRDAGWKPALLAHVHYPDTIERQFQTERIRVIRVPALQASHSDWRSPVEYGWALRNVLVQERIDIYHLHSALVGLEARSLFTAITAHVPSVITYHCIPWNETRRRRLLMIAAHRIFHPKTIAVSRAVAEMAWNNYQVPRHETAIILNGVEEILPHATEQTNASTYDLATRPDDVGGEVVIGVAARLERVKGIDVLLDAIALLDPSLRIRVVVAGEGPERAALETQAQRLNISHKIEFLGFRSDIRQLMHQWNLLVLPSRGQEGLPLTVIEAFSSQLPVVATWVGGLPEIIQEGTTGWLVAPESAPQLAAALTEAISQPLERTRRGLAGHAIFMSELRADVMMQKTFAVYHEVLGVKPHQVPGRSSS